MKAAEMAISNPLIDDYTLKGAKGLLVNITGGKDLKLFEVDEAVNKVRAEVDPEAELIIGAITDPALEGHDPLPKRDAERSSCHGEDPVPLDRRFGEPPEGFLEVCPRPCLADVHGGPGGEYGNGRRL